MESDTTYSRLLKGFDALYRGLTEINPHDFLTTVQTTSFIIADIFAKSLPADCFLKNLFDVVEQYLSEIIVIIDTHCRRLQKAFLLKKVPYLVLDQRKIVKLVVPLKFLLLMVKL